MDRVLFVGPLDRVLLLRTLPMLEGLGPGTWLFVDHPAFDDPEMRAGHHVGYEDVAVICRRGNQSQRALLALKAAGLPKAGRNTWYLDSDTSTYKRLTAAARSALVGGAG